MPDLAERGPRLRFAQADVDRFAAASGDRNPLHVDPAFARRSAFGGRVVHGALVALGMLGTLPADALGRVTSLRASFTGAVLPGTELAVALRPGSRGRFELAASGRGKQLARILAGTQGDPAVPVDLAALAPPPAPAAMRAQAVTLAAGDLGPGRAAAGAYAPDESALAALAADLGAAALRPALREGLAWASYAVGMELPGRDALLTGITLAEGDGAAAALHSIRLREHDERTGRLAIDGALLDRAGAARAFAQIECFLLGAAAVPDALAPPPPGAPSPDRGTVVIVGGSRGFGAALALALLAAGYAVHVVYSSAADGAAALADAAGALAHGLTLHCADARDERALRAVAEALGGPLAGLVLNAAPPLLPMGLTGESAAELAGYVADSVALAAVPLGTLAPLVDRERGWVVITSSPAFTAPPRDWPHYAAAKGALEGLGHWLAASAPGLRTVILRPPRMATDLTNTPSGRLGAAPAGAIAGWTAARLRDPELAAGLTLLEPDASAR